MFNTAMEDIEQTFNTPTPVAYGGTGATNLADARTNLNVPARLGTQDGTVDLTAGGQVRFPVTQIPSADPKTLDDYEEGVWTPTLTFTTPGNLSVGYISRSGTYIKIGKQLIVNFTIVTSSFTHTTALGSLAITGLPAGAEAITSQEFYGTLSYSGITKAGYQYMSPRLINNSTILSIVASASGLTRSLVEFTDVPTGGQVVLIGSIMYRGTV